MLQLVLKKKWFDLILSGQKPEEYREIKEYWIKRLFVNHREYFTLLKNKEMKHLPVQNRKVSTWILGKCAEYGFWNCKYCSWSA